MSYIIMCPLPTCHFLQLERFRIISANTALCDRRGLFNDSLSPGLGTYTITCNVQAHSKLMYYIFLKCSNLFNIFN